MSRRRPLRIPGTPNPRTLYVLPAIPDELEPAAKDALALRNACATEGFCRGCGAVGEIRPDRHHEGILHYVFQHEPSCPVLADGDVA